MSVRYSAGISTAYGAAKRAGYTGSYTDFCNALAALVNMFATAETLQPSEPATADYTDGVLTIGVPKGEQGEQGATGATGNGIASIAKTGTSGLVDTYTITYTNGNTSTFTVTNGEDGEVTYDYLEANYPEKSGVIDNALQLASNNGITDQVPYLFRQSKSGDREYDEIVGATMAWNQLVNTGDTSVTVPSGHKYYSRINGTETIGSSNGTAISINDDSKDDVCDLTLAVGSTIADYLYTLESGTSGAGVAKLKEWGFCVKPKYSYNAGSIESVNISAHKMVGFNQWDEEWVNENKDIDTTTGQLVPSGTYYYFRSKNYIPILPNAVYFDQTNITGSYRLFFYDASKNYISYVSHPTRTTFVTPNNAYYMLFRNSSNSGTIYQNDICINFSDPVRNGEYEPYWTKSYPLDSTKTLNGIYRLDESNNLYADGDTYEPDGTVTRNFAEDSITINSVYASSGNADYDFAIATLSEKWQSLGNAIGEKVLPNINSKSFSSQDIPIGTLISYSSANKQVGITVAKGTTKAQAEATYNGSKVVYKLATPTTESADPFQTPQMVDEYGTEEYIDYAESQGTRDVAVPVGHNTRYPTNQVKKLDGLPSDFSTLIAPTEATMKATRNYTANDFLIVANQLYKVTANIASGGTITVGSNVTATTLAEQVTALLNA